LTFFRKDIELPPVSYRMIFWLQQRFFLSYQGGIMMSKVFLVVAMTLVFAGVVYAANPADLTSNHRSFVCEFYKLGYDGGPRFACANLPINGTVNTQIFNWQNKNGNSRLSQLIIAKQFSSWLDGAVDVIFTGDNLSENVIIDVHWNALGLGIILPLEYGEDVSISPRTTIKGLTTFATLSKDEKPLWGLSRALVKEVKAEIAYGDGTWFVRASRSFETSFGTFIPESRNKLTKDEKFFGLALGFIPN